MAIVREIMNRYGGVILVADDAYRTASEAELQRRREETNRAIIEIDRAWQLARMEEEQKT